MFVLFRLQLKAVFLMLESSLNGIEKCSNSEQTSDSVFLIQPVFIIKITDI